MPHLPAPKGPSKYGQKYMTWAANGGELYRIEGAASDMIYILAKDAYLRELRKGHSHERAQRAYQATESRLVTEWGVREGWLE
jgi:hypothetical protein